MHSQINSFNYGLLNTESRYDLHLSVVDSAQNVRIMVTNCLAISQTGQPIDIQKDSLTLTTSLNELAQKYPALLTDTEQDFRIILTTPTSASTVNKLAVSAASELSADTLSIGQLKMNYGVLNNNEDYIPPCSTINSHIHLRAWADQIRKRLSEAQRDAIFVVRKVCEKRGTEDARRAGVLAELIRDWCEQLVIAVDDTLNKMSFTAYEQPPIYLLEAITLTTRRLQTSLTNLNNPALSSSVRSGNELMLKYIHDWSDIPNERLLSIGLERVINYRYEHNNIQPHLLVITQCWTDIIKVLNTLSKLDYIGQERQDRRIRSDSVVIFPDDIPSQQSTKSDYDNPPPIRRRLTDSERIRWGSLPEPHPEPVAPKSVDSTPLPLPPLSDYPSESTDVPHQPLSSLRPQFDIRSWIADTYSALFNLPKLMFSSKNRPGSEDEKPLILPTNAPVTPTMQPVNASAYAPEWIRRGESFLIVATLHPPDAAAASDLLVNRIDSTLTRVTVKPLAQPLLSYQKITFHLIINNLTVKEPIQEIRWQDQLTSVEFLLNLPNDYIPNQVRASLYVSSNDIPLGNFKFAISVGDTMQSKATKNADFITFRQAFISYASANRNEVLKRVQALEANGQKVFMDLTSLASGERWEPTIFNQIEVSDVFYLFWSKAAKKSKWVEREWMHALSTSDRNKSQSPLIIPIIIEGPPPPTPPEQLKHLHFNDRHLYFIGKS